MFNPPGDILPANPTAMMLDKIREASQDGLVLCFAGVGSAFAKRNDQTSLIVAKHGVTLLVDIGGGIPASLARQGIKTTDFDFYHITHSHADHIGGLEELLLTFRYVKHVRPKFILTERYQRILWEDSLRGGCGYSEGGPLQFGDFIEPILPCQVEPHGLGDQPRERYRERYHICVGDMHLEIFRTRHYPDEAMPPELRFWSTGLLIDGTVLFTGDTRFDPQLFEDIETPGVAMAGVTTIFHDCQLCEPGRVHATYRELTTLPPHLKSKMWLTHYGDNFEDFDPVRDGFRGFAAAWQIYRV